MVATKSYWETTTGGNGKYAFLKQNVSGTSGLGVANRAHM